jgi:hypothetical protein
VNPVPPVVTVAVRPGDGGAENVEIREAPAAGIDGEHGSMIPGGVAVGRPIQRLAGQDQLGPWQRAVGTVKIVKINKVRNDGGD